VVFKSRIEEELAATSHLLKLCFGRRAWVSQNTVSRKVINRKEFSSRYMPKSDWIFVKLKPCSLEYHVLVPDLPNLVYGKILSWKLAVVISKVDIFGVGLESETSLEISVLFSVSDLHKIAAQYIFVTEVLHALVRMQEKVPGIVLAL
jgi:hypothetical protein